MMILIVTQYILHTVFGHHRADPRRGVQWFRHLWVQREPSGHSAPLRLHPDGPLQRDRDHRRLYRSHRHQQFDRR